MRAIAQTLLYKSPCQSQVSIPNTLPLSPQSSLPHTLSHTITPHLTPLHPHNTPASPSLPQVQLGTSRLSSSLATIAEVASIIDAYPTWLINLGPTIHTLLGLLFHSCRSFPTAAAHFAAAQAAIQARCHPMTSAAAAQQPARHEPSLCFALLGQVVAWLCCGTREGQARAVEVLQSWRREALYHEGHTVQQGACLEWRVAAALV